MASLKEIKLRVASVKSTEKITSAMKIVSSSRLHHAEGLSDHTLAYTTNLGSLLDNLLSSGEDDLSSPYLEKREVKHVAIIPVSSSSGLCGAFNSNIWKELNARIDFYKQTGAEVKIYPVGKKVSDSAVKAGFSADTTFMQIGVHPAFASAEELANKLMKAFEDKEIDKVELIYHHFKNRGRQILTTREWLPMEPLQKKEASEEQTEYFFEPSVSSLLKRLLPKMLRMDIYTTLLDASTSEHAARVLAMQTANDNANDLISDLTLQYNKTRQQSITNELLDIVGGSVNR